MEEHQYTPEALEHCRRTTGTALSAGAKCVSRAPRTDSNQVAVEFAWEVPLEARAPIIFQVRISREGRESSIRFTIDLNRLQTDDLQALHDLLAYPPRDYWLARAVAWLVDASLRQQQPHWSDEQRNQKVREVLLAPP